MSSRSQSPTSLPHAPIPGWRLLAAACLALALGACEAEDGLGDAGPEDTFTQLYNAIGSRCSGCHAPGAAGNTPGTEQTQDWSSRDSALQSLRGAASGLMGNFEGCNGVDFVGDSVETSLIVAAFDEDVRADFTVASSPDCTVDAISDMQLKVEPDLSASEIALLKQWVMEEISAP